MKKFIKDFCIRGMLFAWMAPVIVAIVWLCLQAAGTVSVLTVNEACLAIFSSTFMGFVAAGISVVYQVESLPKAMAGLIQMVVLYIDYLGIYLLNGWIPVSKVWIFSVCFVAGFALIWFGIYMSIRAKVKKMNEAIKG